MKEKYESLSLATLKDLAKARGLKGISTMRKPELIERMLEEDKKEQTAENEQTISGTAEENTIPARPEYAVAEKTENSGSVSAPERREAPTRSRTIIRRNPEYRSNNSNNYGRSENTGRQNSYNGENRPENFVKRTPVAKPVEVVPPAELRPEETEQPRTGAASENRTEEGVSNAYNVPAETVQLDSGEKANGILEVMPDGFGFIRGENDIYVSPSQIRRFNLKTGDIIQGNIRIKTQGEKFSALLYVTSINGFHPSEGQKRYNFENMTPIFPDERLIMERPGGTTAMRIVDLISPIGKGQRGMIVSPPKAGKTTLLKDVAKSILKNNKDMHLIILLIDERPEEVTDIREAIQGPNVEVIYSTFDELPEHHKRVSEMVVERARRLVEHKQDVVILLDSITRLARAYNLVVPPSGRTLSGGLDPGALHMPKRFFGAARNMREGGSLTILATALVDTGSKMDDVIYEEFKGTGNMELVLDRKLQEKRVFPAIDIQKSGTRREDLLLSKDEQEAVYIMRKALNGMKSDEAVEQILNMFARTANNAEFVQMVKKQKL